ncbi:MAG: septal ring lytic transglycosylase RlpA family protein [Sideroxydans sp.]|nr:septal ring lytic transglycosylase RlpA family protein [Sideroxydans sp.]
MNRQTGLIVIAALILSACSSMPSHQPQAQKAAPVLESGSTPGEAGGGYLAGDGPGNDIPANLDSIPDAVPRAEPLHPYANRPYVALGRTYTPLTVPGNFKERGIASWYGKKFHGQRTSSGEVYDMFGMTAAHPTLPIPSYARVTNLANGKSVVVRINDRGPFMHDRIIDLSYAAAYKLGLINNGSGEVEVDSIVPGQDTPPVATSTVQAEPLPPAAPPPAAAPAPAPVATTTVAASGNVYLQLGAFRSEQGAESFLAKMRSALGDTGKQLSLFRKSGLVRVHLGPYASKDAASGSAAQLQGKLGFKPLVSLH